MNNICVLLNIHDCAPAHILYLIHLSYCCGRNYRYQIKFVAQWCVHVCQLAHWTQPNIDLTLVWRADEFIRSATWLLIRWFQLRAFLFDKICRQATIFEIISVYVSNMVWIFVLHSPPLSISLCKCCHCRTAESNFIKGNQLMNIIWLQVLSKLFLKRIVSCQPFSHSYIRIRYHTLVHFMCLHKQFNYDIRTE